MPPVPSPVHSTPSPPPVPWASPGNHPISLGEHLTFPGKHPTSLGEHPLSQGSSLARGSPGWLDREQPRPWLWGREGATRAPLALGTRGGWW